MATALLVGVALMEALALLVGVSPSHWFDGMFADVHHPDTPASAALGWLHFGKVPFLAIIVIFLTTFAVTGIVVQLIAVGVLGAFVPPLAAVAVAGVGGVASVRVLGAARCENAGEGREHGRADRGAGRPHRGGRDRDRDRRSAGRGPHS